MISRMLGGITQERKANLSKDLTSSFLVLVSISLVITELLLVTSELLMSFLLAIKLVPQAVQLKCSRVERGENIGSGKLI